MSANQSAASSGGSAEFNVRGYAIVNAAAYLREALGEAEGRRVIEMMSPRVREVLASKKPAEWAPVAALTEITRAVAANAKGDNARAQEMLVTCGTFMAQEAANTFLKLLLKLITPDLLAKKIPDIWSRDFSCGRLVAEASPGRILCQAYGMQGFDHAVCTSAGFVSFVLGAMGKTIKSTTIRDWSLTNPCQDGASFEITW